MVTILTFLFLYKIFLLFPEHAFHPHLITCCFVLIRYTIVTIAGIPQAIKKRHKAAYFLLTAVIYSTVYYFKYLF